MNDLASAASNGSEIHFDQNLLRSSAQAAIDFAEKNGDKLPFYVWSVLVVAASQPAASSSSASSPNSEAYSATDSNGIIGTPIDSLSAAI